MYFFVLNVTLQRKIGLSHIHTQSRLLLTLVGPTTILPEYLQYCNSHMTSMK